MSSVRREGGVSPASLQSTAKRRRAATASARAVLLSVLVALLSLPASRPTAQAPEDPEIRLVLLIAVDQFRYDYLTRFRSEYTQGIRSLLTNGAVFTNAHLEHYPTVTAIGHATMLSGATPSVSGIVGNDWFDRETGRTVTSVSDPTVTPVGSATGSAASPRRLLVTTVGDELEMASVGQQPKAIAPRVFGVSLKDRSAILPVGRGADGAYWWDARTGFFTTSTYYQRALPEWARQFNERKPADAFSGKPWTARRPPGGMLRQLPAAPGPALYDAVYGSAFGNDLLLDFTLALLEGERLGTRGATDLLSVSFSSNDAVGHAYGPDSAQVHDITLRTDLVVGRLLEAIDRTIGLNRTLIAFTSDHGVAPLPEVLHERALPGGRLRSRDLFDPIERALAARFGEGKWLLSTAGSSPYLNYELAAERQIDLRDVRTVAAEAAWRVPHVASVYTRDQLAAGQVPDDRFARRVLRGFHPQRSGDLEILFEPFWIRQAEGTTHGTPYNYDSHIPLILMGPGVRPGSYLREAALNDLAPTLAHLLKIETPAGSSGRILSEAILQPSGRPPGGPQIAR
jgi:predicted AlkP superfamily pyrophosphatase or phosphodiesterase